MGILRHLRKIEVVSFTLEMYGIPRNGERVQISNLKKINIHLTENGQKLSFNFPYILAKDHSTSS